MRNDWGGWKWLWLMSGDVNGWRLRELRVINYDTYRRSKQSNKNNPNSIRSDLIIRLKQKKSKSTIMEGIYNLNKRLFERSIAEENNGSKRTNF